MENPFSKKAIATRRLRQKLGGSDFPAFSKRDASVQAKIETSNTYEMRDKILSSSPDKRTYGKRK
jgi:hypothetical protein